jgi:hypothetical protein
VAGRTIRDKHGWSTIKGHPTNCKKIEKTEAKAKGELLIKIVINLLSCGSYFNAFC